MKIRLYIAVFAMLFYIAVGQKAAAQSLPPGTCGIVYTYDAAGNRTGYQYVCNNNPVADVQRNQMMRKAVTDSVQALQVNTLYPNPTTGIFTVKMAQPLNNATVTIVNVSGHIVLKTTATGSTLQYDLSRYTAGLYLIHITQGRQTVTMKVLKH